MVQLRLVDGGNNEKRERARSVKERARQFKSSANFRRRMHEAESSSWPHNGRQLGIVAPLQSKHVLVELDGLCFPPLLSRAIFFGEDDLIKTDHRPMSWVDRGL